MNIQFSDIHRREMFDMLNAGFKLKDVSAHFDASIPTIKNHVDAYIKRHKPYKNTTNINHISLSNLLSYSPELDETLVVNKNRRPAWVMIPYNEFYGKLS